MKERSVFDVAIQGHMDCVRGGEVLEVDGLEESHGFGFLGESKVRGSKLQVP